jgi:hypothetical protein
MFLELIATFVIGLGAAGMVMLLNKALRGRLPRWLIPAAAGFSMLGFSVWSEYSWYGRTAASLPDEVVIAWSNEESAPWKPWTYLFPQTTRFVAVDTGTIRTNATLPDQRMVDLFLLGRWAAGRQVRIVLDCAGNRRADLMEGVEMDASGSVDPGAWVSMPADDPVLGTACSVEVG